MCKREVDLQCSQCTSLSHIVILTTQGLIKAAGLSAMLWYLSCQCRWVRSAWEWMDVSYEVKQDPWGNQCTGAGAVVTSAVCQEASMGNKTPPLSPFLWRRWISEIIFPAWTVKTLLPGRDLDPEIAVNCNGQEGKNWTLRQHQHCARHEQAAVKVSLESDADGNGQRDDKGSHRNIRQSQGDDETKRGISQRFINFHRPNHHHIPDYRRQCNHHLHSYVERLRWKKCSGHPCRWLCPW